MNKRYLATVATVMLGTSSAAMAEFGVGVKASTLGAGIELGTALTDTLAARVALNKYSKDDDQTIDDIDYTAELDLNSSALFLDWHPFSGTFHLTAGYLFSNSDLSASATPANSVEIGGTVYNPSDIGRIDATVNLGSGPYVGLGWGNVAAKGFGFTFELGVVQQGTPDVDLTIEDPNGVIAANNDIEKERKNMEDDLDEFDLYPVVSLGVSYGF